MIRGAGEAAPTFSPVWLKDDSPAFPASLRDLSHPPAGLWCLGDPDALSSSAMVAIVGTREASPYGERTATRLASACARAGLVVVSGLARGIDAAAHRAAMAAGGRTVAVQGPGVDVPYPAAHRSLHRTIQAQGAVVSEMEPGTLAFPGCFPRRNRIIAALAKVTVVVEAGFKSGAINTAAQALDLGRTVAAVPGQIDDPRAAGTNLLIRDGAHVITDVEDLLMTMGLSTNAGVAGQGLDPVVGESLPEDLREILSRMAGSEFSAAELASESKMSARQASESLLRLELAGLVERVGSGYRRVGR